MDFGKLLADILRLSAPLVIDFVADIIRDNF